MTAEPHTVGLLNSVRFRLSLAVTLVSIFPIVLALIAVNAVASSTVRNGLGNNLGDRLTNDLPILVNSLSGQVDMLTTLAGSQAIIDGLKSANNNADGNTALLAARDVGWQADRSETNPLIVGVLNHPISQALSHFQANFPAHGEVFVTDNFGAIVAATGITTDYYQGDEAWWQSAWNEGVGAIYIADQVEFDESAGIMSLNIAVPVRDYQMREVVGVLRTTYDVTALAAILDDLAFLETGRILLVNRNGNDLLAEGEAPFIAPSLMGIPQANFIEDPNGVRVAAKTLPLTTDGRLTAIDQLGWHILAVESEQEIYRSANNAVGLVMAAGLVVMVIAIVLGLAIAQWLTRPLPVLASAARRLREGDWKARVEVRSQDEFGEMGVAFNAMAEQLETILGSLEERVASRTRDLETVAFVNQQISTILNVDRLLQDVVDLTKERFRLYHAHVYLLNEENDTLMLTAGAGHVGRKMVSDGRQIALDNQQSIVARAATTRKPVMVQDVTKSPTFLPNPLLPDTRAELAVPLVARGQLRGVLDVQSDTTNYFGADVVGVVELLAGQIASALSNASLYEVADRTSRHERALGNIDRHIQGAAGVDEILQVAVRELGKALRVPHTAIEMRMNAEPDANGELDYQANS